jgi:Fe2+ transport system protein FeoA
MIQNVAEHTASTSTTIGLSSSSSASLAEMGPGMFRCQAVLGNDDSAKRLKRLGICEGHQVEVLYDGNPMFIVVAGSQIGLSRALAKLVVIDQDFDASF